MVEADQETVKALAITTGLFGSGEWRSPSLTNLEEGHRWIVAVSEAEEILGAAYFAPEPIAFKLWNTYFLAVNKNSQGKGIGRQIMIWIENLAHQEEIRTLMVETSSMESFAQARGFYQSLGYTREAEIRNYYGINDNKVIYLKTLI